MIVGTVGHRILADTDEVAAGVGRALRRIERSFPGRPLRVLSGLAEGSDRLVAEAILARPGATLTAVLPLHVEEYIEDFLSPASRAEFERLLAGAAEVVVMDSQPVRDESYAAAARYVLHHSDVVIAIWDGRGAHGRGGTGETVASARSMGLPLAWIKAGNREPGTMRPTTLRDQGAVAFENF